MKSVLLSLSLMVASAFLFSACTSGPELIGPATPQDLTSEEVEQEMTNIESELDTLDEQADFPDLNPDDFTE